MKTDKFSFLQRSTGAVLSLRLLLPQLRLPCPALPLPRTSTRHAI